MRKKDILEYAITIAVVLSLAIVAVSSIITARSLNTMVQQNQASYDLLDTVIK